MPTYLKSSNKNLHIVAIFRIGDNSNYWRSKEEKDIGFATMETSNILFATYEM